MNGVFLTHNISSQTSVINLTNLDIPIVQFKTNDYQLRRGYAHPA